VRGLSAAIDDQMDLGAVQLQLRTVGEKWQELKQSIFALSLSNDQSEDDAVDGGSSDKTAISDTSSVGNVDETDEKENQSSQCSVSQAEEQKSVDLSENNALSDASQRQQQPAPPLRERNHSNSERQVSRCPESDPLIQTLWSSFREKLNGDQQSVDEQVDRLIADALDENNLAQMYEGWTAWV
jgi:hypothetical protein